MYKRNRHSAELVYTSRPAVTLTPACLDEFKAAIKPLKGAPETPESKAKGQAIVAHYAGRLQMADLNLSQADALALLAAAYKSL
jgi:hypothetical protein